MVAEVTEELKHNMEVQEVHTVKIYHLDPSYNDS